MHDIYSSTGCGHVLSLLLVGLSVPIICKAVARIFAYKYELVLNASQQCDGQ